MTNGITGRRSFDQPLLPTQPASASMLFLSTTPSLYNNNNRQYLACNMGVARSLSTTNGGGDGSSEDPKQPVDREEAEDVVMEDNAQDSVDEASSPPAKKISTIEEYEEEFHVKKRQSEASTIDPDSGRPFFTMSNDELKDTSTIVGYDLVHTPPKKIPRGALLGRVVSSKNHKTLMVEVDRWKMVKRVGLKRRYTRRFMTHDEKEVGRNGDLVLIVPCQRISRRKHFMLHEIVRTNPSI